MLAIPEKRILILLDAVILFIVHTRPTILFLLRDRNTLEHFEKEIKTSYFDHMHTNSLNIVKS